MRTAVRSSISAAWTFCSLLAAASAAHAGAITISSASVSPTTVGLYQPLTVGFKLSKTYANPYDPDAVDARFEFTGPSGIVRTIPAYWTGGTVPWRAKIVPLEIGVHSCRILVSDSAGDSGSYAASFTAIASSARGFIRSDSRDPRFLRFDDGTAYHPIGHDVCWYGNDSNFTNWMNNMAAAGENWTRYWILSYTGQDIEWGGGTSSQLGTYSQGNAQLIDNMFEAVRSRGIYVQACLDSFNGWNLTFYSNWVENPYNAANGGMCTRPNDYFINAEAQRYAKRRFRYIVARWAWNPAILCWEFFNEVDAVGGDGATFWGHEAEIAQWHQTMAQYIRSIDPFAHLRTTSFADDGPRSSYRQFWQLPEMDIVQVHQYSLIFPQEHVSLIRDAQQFGKPVILGEGDKAGDPGSLDSNGQSLHDIIWASAAVQSGGMSWWWDNWIHPKNLYYRFKPLVAFMAGEDWAPEQLSALSCTVLAGYASPEIYGSGGPRSAYAYLRYPSGAVNGLRLRFNQVTTPGTYTVEYWDTNSQASYRTDTLTIGSTALVVDVPNFTRDVAVKIKRMGAYLVASPISLTVSTYFGTDAEPQSFTIVNTGALAADYAISSSEGWLSTTPDSGNIATETDTIAVGFSTEQLAVGTYSANITVTDTTSGGPPVVVPVSLTVMSLPGDFDDDGDVDQEDYGRFQACLLGGNVEQSSPGCQAARLDWDSDVDEFDAAIFMGCFAGPNVPANPHCAD